MEAKFCHCGVKKAGPSGNPGKSAHFCPLIRGLHGTENCKNVVLRTAEFMKDLGHSPILKKKDFERIANSVLICSGALDRMATVEESEEMGRWLRNGAFRVLEGFKHPLQAVPHVELASILESYLDGRMVHKKKYVILKF